ncbi:type 1 glutamine amidotransferase [Aggregicoccus sp. 17bor-14]|uniref:type 1 glutamine amidotransferase domain-containing protein n=1 Tax=Myxococcaceae TaxID=31 RepID=UPI00129CE25C|nr:MULTISPECIES: type 1 glutamine amidotransferase domain-containing protein [Myxococcaceae]MBF5043817.1 type 1 glutamine amidotransferase [Simulacricoccus sp. 17bor-14]MRI89569.1 type 1 glutamine amidotransferase [Aggregicoccus sp. 17bor-14]
MAKTLRGLRVAVLAADGFEQVELTVPLKALRNAGAHVEVVSVHAGSLRGMNGLEPGKEVRVDRRVSAVGVQDYDALFIPGGFVSPDLLRQSDAVRELVRAFDEAGLPIGTLCHGPWVLASAGLTRGRHLTSWPGIRDDLTNAGARWEDLSVVRDGNWVSSRGPQDLTHFVPALLSLYAESEAAARARARVRARWARRAAGLAALGLAGLALRQRRAGALAWG